MPPENGFFGIKAQSDIICCDVKSIPGNVGGRWVAGEGVVVGDEIKAVVVGLELQVLTHCAKEIAYVKSAGRLYARKNSQNKLLIPKIQILWKSLDSLLTGEFCVKITELEADVKDFE